MVDKITAVFDGKVFRPIEHVALAANTRVRIAIEVLPPSGTEVVSFLETARSLSLNGPDNWSSNIDNLSAR
jgi:hypothetical protein